MQTKREYLASKGLAIAGARGKFSNDAKAELARVEAEGMRFSDSDKVKASKPTGPVTPKPIAPKVSAGIVDYLLPSDFRFPEGEYKAVVIGTKRVHSMRECCNNCRVSLTNHQCEAPTVNGEAVKIVPRSVAA